MPTQPSGRPPPGRLTPPVTSTATPTTSPTVPLDTALARSEPLGRLMQRLRESTDCLEAVRPLLPPGLADEVRAGPLDEQGWTLLVSGSAAAAKLRQLLPTLEATLLGRRQRAIAVRVKIAPRAR
jgi:hypothetical protein